MDLGTIGNGEVVRMIVTLASRKTREDVDIGSYKYNKSGLAKHSQLGEMRVDRFGLPYCFFNFYRRHRSLYKKGGQVVQGIFSGANTPRSGIVSIQSRLRKSSWLNRLRRGGA